MIALSIVVSIQTGFIIWLYGKYWIYNRFIKQMGLTVNYHSKVFFEIAIQKALENENYELANEFKNIRINYENERDNV